MHPFLWRCLASYNRHKLGWFRQVSGQKQLGMPRDCLRDELYPIPASYRFLCSPHFRVFAGPCMGNNGLARSHLYQFDGLLRSLHSDFQRTAYCCSNFFTWIFWGSDSSYEMTTSSHVSSVVNWGTFRSCGSDISGDSGITNAAISSRLYHLLRRLMWYVRCCLCVFPVSNS